MDDDGAKRVLLDLRSALPGTLAPGKMFALLRRLTRLLQLPDENERLCVRVHELEARVHELEEQLAQARASWAAAATENRIGTMTNQVSGDGDLRSSHGQLIAAVCAIFGLVVVIASVVIAMFGLVVAASSNPDSPSMLEQLTAALRQQAGQSFATEAFKWEDVLNLATVLIVLSLIAMFYSAMATLSTARRGLVEESRKIERIFLLASYSLFLSLVMLIGVFLGAGTNEAKNFWFAVIVAWVVPIVWILPGLESVRWLIRYGFHVAIWVIVVGLISLRFIGVISGPVLAIGLLAVLGAELAAVNVVLLRRRSAARRRLAQQLTQ